MMNLSVIICGTKHSVDVTHFQKMEEVSLIHVKRRVNKINSIELFSLRQKGFFHTYHKITYVSIILMTILK